MSSRDASVRPLAASPTLEPPVSTEAVECASLAHILDTRNHRPMLRLQALQIIEGVCRSLDHAHHNGSVHGDVQPEKIFVTSEGHVRLIGHGSKPTPAYASCEVLEGAAPVAADDLFSAACTGYQLLAGESAFGAGTALQAEAAAQRPVRIPHLSPGQWRALDRALAFRRAERQLDIESFLDELRSQYPGQSDGDATASMPGLPITSSEGSHSLRLPVMAAGITGITALVIATGWWLLRAPEAPVSTVPPPVAAASPEARRIVRKAEVLPAIDSVAAPTPAATTNTRAALATPSPEGPKPQPVVSLSPRQNQAEQTTADQTPPAVTPGTADTGLTAAAEPSAAGLLSPTAATERTALLAPRPVAPALSALAALTAPPVTLPATPVAGNGIYMVPFSSLKVRRYVEPDYPRNREGVLVPGWVDVSFSIDEEGRTTDLKIMAANPAGLFDAAALAAVRRWRFAAVPLPAGSDQTVRSEIRVRFAPD